MEDVLTGLHFFNTMEEKIITRRLIYEDWDFDIKLEVYKKD